MAGPFEWEEKWNVNLQKTLIFPLLINHLKDILLPHLQSAVLAVHYPLAFLIGPQINGSLKHDKFNNAESERNI